MAADAAKAEEELRGGIKVRDAATQDEELWGALASEIKDLKGAGFSTSELLPKSMKEAIDSGVLKAEDLADAGIKSSKDWDTFRKQVANML